MELDIIYEIPRLVKDKIQEIDSESEIMLFGSRARGESRDSSDWDFLILMNQKITKDLKNQIQEELYDLELETDQIISSIIHEKSKWLELAVTSLFQIIQEEGIEV